MTNDETRRYRLNELITEHHTVAALARTLEVSPSQVSQWRNASPDSKTGKPRTMSDGAARRIEDKCGKARGWMDTPPVEYNIDNNQAKGTRVATELVPANYGPAEIEARARSLCQRATDIAAMWMRLPVSAQNEIEHTLRIALKKADSEEADRAVITRPSTRKNKLKSSDR